MRTLALVLFIAVIAAGTAAAAPSACSYQGRLDVDGQPFMGDADFKFVLLCGTSSAWSSDGTSTNGSEPTAALTLAVDEGIFSVLLGDAALGMPPLLAALLADCATPRFRVWVDTGGGFEQLGDQALASSPFALTAESAAGAQGLFVVDTDESGGIQITGGGSLAMLDAGGSTEAYIEGAAGEIGCRTLRFADGSTLTTATGAGGGDNDWIVNGNDMSAGVSGNVGIGTSAPLAKLHLSAPAEAPEIRLNGDGAMVAGSSWGAMTLHRNGITLGRNRWRGSADGNPDYSLEVTSQPNALVIDGSSGVLGMGTPTPSVSKTLTLQGVGAGSGWLQFRTSAGVDAWHMTNEAGGLNFIESGVATNRLFLMPGGNVGIGTNAPGARLDVAGSTIVRGNLTVMGTIGSGSQPRYHALDVAAFQASTSDLGYSRTAGALAGTITNQALAFAAPLELPDGARITTIVAYFRDSEAVFNFTFRLTKTEHAPHSYSVLTTGTSTGTPGDTSLTLANLDILVDQASASYACEAFWTTPTLTTNIRLQGARIEYTLP